MDTLRLQPSDMTALMQKLATNFGGKKDLAQKADLWYDHLHRFPLAVVERVIDQLLSEDRQYFPQVGRAIALARTLAPEIATPAARQMRAWESDPWRGIELTDAWRAADLASTPCPVCLETIRFSPRGWQVTHLDGPHALAQVGYSNMGKGGWWDLGPLPPLRNLRASPESEPNNG